MGTIADKLNYLEETKQSIRTAIENKGITISDTDSFRSYGDKINNITVGEGANYGFDYDETKVDQEMYNLSSNYVSAAITKINQIPANLINRENLSYAFNRLSKITTLPLFDTTNTKKMGSLFYNCYDLAEVPFFNTSNVTDMSCMFAGCRNITTIPNFDTSKVTYFNAMFNNCTKLSNIPLLDMSSATRVDTMFSMITHSNEVIIAGFKNLGKSYTATSKNYSSYKLSLANMEGITHDSLMNVINNLYDLNLTYDVANGGTLYEQSLVLGSANIARLTEDEIAIATNKGWIVS